MKLPKKIRLLNKTIDVILIPEEICKTLGVDAYCESDPYTIYVCEKFNNTPYALELLIHECSHIVSMQFLLELDELQVNTLGAGLAQMLAGIIKE